MTEKHNTIALGDLNKAVSHAVDLAVKAQPTHGKIIDINILGRWLREAIPAAEAQKLSSQIVHGLPADLQHQVKPETFHGEGGTFVGFRIG